MPESTQSTQQTILLAGREEFLKHGFEKASLRTIAQNAGVTTGAIYGYYSDKAALFDALVSDPAETLYADYQKISTEFESLTLDEQNAQLGSMAKQELGPWIDYIYDSFDAFELIFACSAGTKWANYVDSLIHVEENSSKRFIARLHESGHHTKELNDHVIHLLAGALFLGLSEMVLHKMTRQEAKSYMETLSEFFTAGWLALLEIERPS